MSTLYDGPRRIRPDELEGARALSQLCFHSVLPDDVGPPAAPLREAGETYIVAAEGRPVSQVRAFHERVLAYDGLLRVGAIGAVCTHPDYRGHGLATQLMDLCTRRLYQGGARLMLISGGRGLYVRLGFIRAGGCACFTLRRGQLAPLGGGVALRRVTPDNAALAGPVCSALYAGEPVRFRRAMEHTLNHLRYDAYGYHRERWIVERDGEPAAYMLLTTDWQSARLPDAPARATHEYAGSRVALAAGLALAAQQPGVEALTVSVPWQDADLIQLLSEMAGPPQWSAIPGHTMRLINFGGLLADLRPYARSRLGPELRRGLRFEQGGPLLGDEGGDRCAIARGGDRLELSAAEMTALVMGAPLAAGEPGALPPLPGALAEIVPALLPLPSFLPGLNYH